MDKEQQEPQSQTKIESETDGQHENGCGGESVEAGNSSNDQPEPSSVVMQEGGEQEGGEQKDGVAAASVVAPTAEAVEPGPYDDNETYKAFVAKRLSRHIATRLMQLIEKNLITTDDVDDRVAEMLAYFPAQYADRIVNEIEESQLYGVQNKPQYLVGVMRHYKDRIRTMGDLATDRPVIPGPSVESIKKIIDRTGYQLDVTVGQRKFHSPPGFTGDASAASSDTSGGGGLYIGQIPRDVYEDALIPLFETAGQIFDLRVMMDPANAASKGYAFVTYCDKTHCEEAAKKYDGYEICPGKSLKVNVSIANTRLFVGNIPKSKSREEILEELKTHLEGVQDVIVYGYPDGGEARKNRGFCFVDFADHKAASDAKRKLQGKVHPWGTQLQVDWAEQQDEPDEETMAHVKVLYVRMLRESVTEPHLQELFSKHGTVEKVKKLKDYAFIHFSTREEALKAMEELKGTVLDGSEIEISLAKPQGDQKQKKRLALKRGGFGGGAVGPLMGMTPGYGGFRGGGHYPPPQYPPYGGGYGARGGAYFGGGGGSMYRGGPRGGATPYRHPSYPPYGAGFDYGGGGYDGYGGGSYGGAYGGGYDDFYGDGGYGGGYGHDSYYGPPPYDHYGQHFPSYGPPRGGYRGGRGGYPTGVAPIRPMMGMMGMGRGGRGVSPGRGRGVKRPGGESGGPSSKRGGGRPDDFTSDVSMNMF